MTDLCRAFGISLKNGYKILERYKKMGAAGLTDRSRRPVRHANQLPTQVEQLTVRTRREKPHWGARKIREVLVRRMAGDVLIPAISTIHHPRHAGPVRPGASAHTPPPQGRGRAVVERQVRDGTTQPRILAFKILHPYDLLGLQAAEFLSPAVMGDLVNAD